MEDAFYQTGKLIPLVIETVECQVPESISLLQCFQYLKPYPIMMAGFCWSADCHTCEVVIRTGSGPEQKALSCQTIVTPGMTVLQMTDKLRFCLRDLLPHRAPEENREIGLPK